MTDLTSMTIAEAKAGLANKSFTSLELTDAHLAALAKAFPPGAAAGARYPEAQLAHMDSEKRVGA
jgi:Asp-tRNA(Asn)/Glu-tRNA(Gln) amidotransferase A subunit family amidase